MKNCLEKCEKMAQPLQNDDAGHLMLRLMLGLLMLPHGISKIGNLDGIMGMLANVGMPGFIAYGVLVGEILAPLMVIFGFRARIGALLMAFTMVVAILLAHPGDILSLSGRGTIALELQYFFLFTSIALMFLGAGKYAVSKSSKWD